MNTLCVTVENVELNYNANMEEINTKLAFAEDVREETDSIPLQNWINEEVSKREEKEIKSWHISKIGQCPRGAYLERIGADPDTEFSDRQLRVFAVGRFFEEWFINLLDNRKELKIKSQVRVESERLDVTGYVDLLVDSPKKKVYEIKTKHSAGFRYIPNRQHQYQLWTYLYLLGIEEGALIYLSKDDLRMAEFPVFLQDKELQQEVFDWLTLVKWAWEEKKYPPLAEEGTWQARFCRWHSQCKQYELPTNP